MGLWDVVIGDYDWTFLCTPRVPWGQAKPAPPLYKPDAQISLFVSFIMGLQHALAMVRLPSPATRRLVQLRHHLCLVALAGAVSFTLAGSQATSTGYTIRLENLHTRGQVDQFFWLVTFISSTHAFADFDSQIGSFLVFHHCRWGESSPCPSFFLERSTATSPMIKPNVRLLSSIPQPGRESMCLSLLPGRTCQGAI